MVAGQGSKEMKLTGGLRAKVLEYTSRRHSHVRIPPGSRGLIQFGITRIMEFNTITC